MSKNTPKTLGGQRTKGELSEQGARSRISTISRIKENWGVSELIDIFPKEIRPTDDLGITAITNIRTISNICPDLKQAQKGMLNVCRNPDGSYRPFSFSQSKSLVEQLKEMKSMVTGGASQSNKKKGGAVDAATPKTPAGYESSAPSSSPVKPKQAQKAKAQAAGQELLMSIGKAAVEPAAAADDGDDEGDSIVVDTAPRRKSAKKSGGPSVKEKNGQTPTLTPPATMPVADKSATKSQGPTMAAAVPVAVMSEGGPQAAGVAATVPVAAMSANDFLRPGKKAKFAKKALLNVAGNDSDSEDSGAEGVGVPANILDLMNGGDWAKPAKKSAEKETYGRMVIPGKNIQPPFSNKRQKRLEEGGISKPSAADKPAQVKKPFGNLLTAAPKPKTFEPPKRRIQKAGDMKKDIEMATSVDSGVQNVDSSKETQHGTGIHPTGGNNETQRGTVTSAAEDNKEVQRDIVISAAEDNKALTAMEDVQVEATAPVTLPTRTQLPVSPKKRTASTMLRAADEPNPQVERSTRPRLEQHAGPGTTEKVIASALQFNGGLKGFTMTAAAALSGNDGEVRARARNELGAYLTSFIDGAEKLKELLREMDEKEN